jgi:hypothetical protein
VAAFMSFKAWGHTLLNCMVVSGTVVGLSMLDRLGGISCSDVRIPVCEVLIENMRRLNDSVTELMTTVFHPWGL